MTERLTDREVEVLQLMAYGLSAARIGRKLGLQPKTVKNHLQRAYLKLGADCSRKHGLTPCIVAVRRALHEGLIEFPPLRDDREVAA